MNLINERFVVTVNERTGGVTAIRHPEDGYEMNWCAAESHWGVIHSESTDHLLAPLDSPRQSMRLKEFRQEENVAVAVYENGMLRVTAWRGFAENGHFAERYTVENLRDVDVFVGPENLAIAAPVNDRYTTAVDCMTGRCNAHIWCGGHTAYVNALRMGNSSCNLGLVLIEGALYNYSQQGVTSNNRGVFLLHTDFFALAKGESYTLAWELFWHSGPADFAEKILYYPQTILVEADRYTLFVGEELGFTVTAPTGTARLTVTDREGTVVCTVAGNTTEVTYVPAVPGEYRFFVTADDVTTWAEFFVVPKLEELLDKRLTYIVNKQQYHNAHSPLDGAYLVYDTKEHHPVFDGMVTDHNACRERVGMALLLAKYLQTHNNDAYYASLTAYIAFLKREFYDEETGAVYDRIQRQDTSRLYNAPWVMQLFAEMYFLTEEAEYAEGAVRIARFFYAAGGEHFYPNAVNFTTVMQMLRQAAHPAADEVLALFRHHADCIVRKGVCYPAHEVNYEQTIVAPAVMLLAQMGQLTGEDIYRQEAEKHLENLRRFNGHQPSYHLCEIPIRYWDGYWFGKRRLFGDVFPHYWSCLTACAYMDCYRLSGKESWRAAAEMCMRNCLCLFAPEGEAYCAYLYPYRSNGQPGQFYDEWANDQDFALYFLLDMLAES